MAEKPEVVRGNPVIPPPPVPSQVRMSAVPIPPTPVPKKDVGGDVVPPSDFTDVEIEEKLQGEVDAHPKGTIVISIFENSPFEVEFSGKITGFDIDIAWKAMMKEYRVWKYKLSKIEIEKEGV